MSKLLEKALEYSNIAHAGHKRLNGEPYVDHTIRVKELLEEIGIEDEKTLASALLHATLSQGTMTYDEIEKEFGEDIASIVYNLSLISSFDIPTDISEDRVHNLHKLFIQLSKDIRVLMIRLADRVDSLRSVDCLPTHDQQRKAENAKKIYAPIAKSIGLYNFTREFENESLKITNPQRYYKIANYLDTHLKNAEDILKNATNEITSFIMSETDNHSITYRKKGIYSVHNKINNYFNQGKLNTLDEFHKINDLLGIRILVDNTDACYNVLAYIQSKWNIVNEEYDDYISNPKPNGYRTLQTAIELTPEHNCEIQIRTFDMHEYNEYGPASHFAYKYAPSDKNMETEWIKDLIKERENINSSLNEKTQTELFKDIVFVYTPKNDLITLPANATPIDFAYAIHTDIGHKCVAANVNGKRVSLKHELQSGDIVEIETSRNQTPSYDWLKISKSKSAQEHIRKFLSKDNG